MFFGVLGVALFLCALFLSFRANDAGVDATNTSNGGQKILVISGRVTEVTDGDSLKIGAQKIRLWGLDAPEYKQQCKLGRTMIACGIQAKNILRDAIGGREITCVQKDVSYDRIVARCTVREDAEVDGGGAVDLARTVIAKGYAISEWKHSGAPYRNDEAAAQNAKRGIWATEFERPSQWRFCNMERHKNRRPKNCGAPYRPR